MATTFKMAVLNVIFRRWSSLLKMATIAIKMMQVILKLTVNLESNYIW